MRGLSLHLVMVMIAVSVHRPVLAAGGGAAPTVDDRARMAHRLVELGRALPEASEMADRLTAEDLAVLLANPEMMQVAGGAERAILTYVIAALIIAGLIAIASSSGGSVSIGGNVMPM